MAQLLEALSKAASGLGSVAIIEGEAGIGKTHLIDALAKEARARGIRTRFAQGSPFERHRPFALIAEALDCHVDPGWRGVTPAEPPRSGLAAAVGGEPSADAAGGFDLELGVDAALQGALEDLCGRAPIMVVLEDLHWADAASLRFLGRLIPKARRLGILVICTARPSPRAPALEQVVLAARRAHALVLRLPPLETDELARIATAQLGAPPGEHLRAKLDACGGSPLFARTLIDALRSDGSITIRGDGTAEVADEQAPAALGLTVLGWLASLPPATVQALQMASVLGPRFSVAELCTVTGRPSTELWQPLREAVAAGALVDAGDQLAFRHELVRDALYEDLPGSVRLALHDDFARALARAGAAPTTVAEHLMRGTRRSDAESVGLLVGAARQAAASSAATAVELLSLAVERVAEDDPLRFELLGELGLRQISAGRRLEGEALCRRVLEECREPPNAAALRLALGSSLMERGLPQEAASEAARILDSDHASPVQRAEAMALCVSTAFLQGQLEAAERSAGEALTFAEDAGAASASGVLLIRLAHLAGSRGEFQSQLKFTERAVGVVERSGSREALHASHAHLNHALALADLDRPDAAAAMIDRARRLFRERGLEEDVRNSHHYASWPLVAAGAWDDALAETETAVTLSEEAGISWVVDVLALQATVLVRRDKLGVAAAAIERAASARAQGAPEFRAGILDWAAALLGEAEGRPEQLEPLWRSCVASSAAGAHGNQRTYLADLARMLTSRGELQRGRRLAGDAEQLARLNPGSQIMLALAVHCRALVEDDRDGLMRACEIAERTTIRPLEHALILEAAAQAAASSGERARARSLGERAVARYEELGALRDLARIRALLRGAGLRPGSRGSRVRAERGWDSLTRSELRVAELAAEGLSNPQIAERLIISRHTVATHIAHILQKLELRSRHELARTRPPERRGR
jgi:DNA-binding CsgD family transcriptional regulator